MDKDLLALGREQTKAAKEMIHASNRQAHNADNQSSADPWHQSQAHQQQQQQQQEDATTYQANSPTNACGQNNSNTKNKKLFPQKLWDLINDDKYNFCLRWSEDGQLVYLNRDDFEDSYLKTAENQFHTQKAISFVRQMNMYGFRKVDDCYYENDNFKRDCKYLLKNMVRKHPIKNNLQQNDATEITPYLYANNQTAAAAAAATTASTLLHSSAPAAATASLLAPSHPQQHLWEISSNEDGLFTDYHAFMDYSRRFKRYPLYNTSSNRAKILNNGNTPDNIIVKTNDSGYLLHQQQTNLLEEERSSNDDSLSSVGDYCCSAASSHGDTSLINVLDKIDSVDQSTTTKHHQQQQQQQQLSDTQYPRDLSTTSTKTNQHLNIHQPDNNNNLNAFYALLSSLNNNLYQPSAHMQAHQNLAFDMNRFSSLQHFYQQILTTTSASTIAQLNQSTAPIVSQNCGPSNTTVTHSYKTPQQQSSPVPTRRIDGLALRNPASDKDTSSFSTSLLMRNKFSANTAKSGVSMEMFENGYRNGCQFSERSHERTKDNKQQQQNYDNALGKPISDSESLATKRRDIKSSMTNRLFKRSVDSILDSNNNNYINNASSEHRSPSNINKRMKVEFDSEDFVDVHSDGERVVNNYAKNLVAHVAQSRDSRVDPDVISEVSRFTQRLVETLFDTAQVIARHSNSSGSSVEAVISNDYCSPSSEERKDKKAATEIEGPRAINLNDLTSALKLLPSKISKLLE